MAVGRSVRSRRYGGAMPSVRLVDGRRLAFAEHGDPRGVPVLVCHGLPGSKRLAADDPMRSQTDGLRIVTVDRPGIGGSDPMPGRTLVDWARDVAQLGDALGVDRWSLFAVSAGGPFALAVAAARPERVKRVALLASLGPMDEPGGREGMPLALRAGWWAVRWMPFQSQLAAQGQARLLARRPEAWVRRFAGQMATTDRRALERPDVQREIIAEGRDAFRQGPGAVAREMRLLAGPWGFDLAAVEAPVRAWCGREDRTSPPSMTLRIVQNVARGSAVLLDAGHLPQREVYTDIAAFLRGEFSVERSAEAPARTDSKGANGGR